MSRISCMQFRIISFAYKVHKSNQLVYLHNLHTIQPVSSACASSLITLLRTSASRLRRSFFSLLRSYSIKFFAKGISSVTWYLFCYYFSSCLVSFFCSIALQTNSGEATSEKGLQGLHPLSSRATYGIRSKQVKTFLVDPYPLPPRP